MRYLLVFVFLFVFLIFVTGDQHIHANGPFGKQHLSIEAPSPYACNRTAGVTSTVTDQISLNVTATRYSTYDQINVTWIPISTSCADDFIGIFFVEIPLTAGTKHKERFLRD